jgi:hypothetical protein
MSSAVSEWFRTFSPLTALSLSCRVPTLCAGSLTAAYDTPPSAMNNASVETTFAYEIPLRARPAIGRSFVVSPTVYRCDAAVYGPVRQTR